jgi:hypothetical protein
MDEQDTLKCKLNPQLQRAWPSLATTIDEAVSRGKSGEPSFHACENGRTVAPRGVLDDFDTEEEAETVGLARARAWVDNHG